MGHSRFANPSSSHFQSQFWFYFAANLVPYSPCKNQIAIQSLKSLGSIQSWFVLTVLFVLENVCTIVFINFTTISLLFIQNHSKSFKRVIFSGSYLLLQKISIPIQTKFLKSIPVLRSISRMALLPGLKAYLRPSLVTNLFPILRCHNRLG